MIAKLGDINFQKSYLQDRNGYTFLDNKKETGMPASCFL
jgi:hypothetical protein